jgi:hypothetical protein
VRTATPNQPAQSFARLDGTLLYVAGENVTFEKCRFDAHGVRAAHIHGDNDRERLVDCSFLCHHRPADSIPVIVCGTYLERCRFEAVGLTEASYIWHVKTQLGRGVTVAGPRLAWHPDKTGVLPEEKP